MDENWDKFLADLRNAETRAVDKAFCHTLKTFINSIKHYAILSLKTDENNEYLISRETNAEIAISKTVYIMEMIEAYLADANP